MEIRDVLAKCDHTLLDVCARWKDIKEVLDDAKAFGCASACIPPCFVKRAREYVGNTLKLCTVIGFPNGYANTAAKVSETKDAIECGADEIDMVINLTDLKDGLYENILTEIKLIKSACRGRVLKVIVEACLLTDGEKVKMCRIVSDSGADYIKTSTGFSSSGATFSDVSLFKKHVSNGVKIKAAGGISSLDDAIRFIELGADRLGTSRIIKIAKKTKDGSAY